MPSPAALTFTFGGLKIDGTARVINTDGEVIPGCTPPGVGRWPVFILTTPAVAD
jgi:hypothetical protein